MEEGRFKLDDFELYKFAREFRKAVYRLVHQLPAVEKYALANQMRRAAVSVSNNIAEGHGRWHYQENIHFCRISRGSVDELIDDLNTCQDERYGDPVLAAELKAQAYDLIRRINSYIAYLRKTKQGVMSDHHSLLTTHFSPLTTHHCKVSPPFPFLYYKRRCHLAVRRTQTGFS